MKKLFVLVALVCIGCGPDLHYSLQQKTGHTKIENLTTDCESFCVAHYTQMKEIDTGICVCYPSNGWQLMIPLKK